MHLSALTWRHRWAALVVLVSVLITGCGADGDTETTVDPAGRNSLNGDWELDALAVDAIEVPGAEFSLSIITETSVVSGRTACHPILGSLTFDAATYDGSGTDSGGLATFTLPGVGTAECSDEELVLETAIVEAMEAVTNWSVQDTTLTLSAPGGTALRFSRTGAGPTP